jgi:hypothetical protein
MSSPSNLLEDVEVCELDELVSSKLELSLMAVTPRVSSSISS